MGLGTALWFVPPPAGVAIKAWHLLSIFLATIAGIITTPLPLGAVAMLGLGASMMTGTLTFAAAFSAFANEVRTTQRGQLSMRGWLANGTKGGQPQTTSGRSWLLADLCPCLRAASARCSC